MTVDALAEAQTARTELHASDAWKRWGTDPATHVFKCGQHLDACIAALQPAPTPTPSPAAATRHFGALRFGSSYPTLKNPGSYGLVVGTVSDAAAIVTLDKTKTRRCVYMGAGDEQTWFTGVDLQEVIAKGWSLGAHTAGGVLADIGNPDFQAAQIREIDAWMRAHGFSAGDGFYFDDLILDPRTLLVSGALPAKYPTVKAWHDNAVIPWVKTVPPALSQLGWYAGANAIAWYPRNDGTTVYPGADPNTGTMMSAFYREICPHLDWVILEQGFYPNNFGLRKEYDASPQWPAFWKNYRDLIPLAESLGCDFYSTVNAVNEAALVYTRATFEIATTGRGGGALCFPQDPADPSAAGGNWAKDLGAPSGAATQSGYVFTRKFANGTVTVDPYAGTAAIS